MENAVSNGKRERRGTKYSPVQLREFRKLIIDTRDAALSDVKGLSDTYASPTTRDENNTYEPEVDFVERSYRNSSLDENARLVERQLQLISYLDAALRRIDNDNYGVCVSCGKLIERMRLLAIPHAMKCVSCESTR